MNLETQLREHFRDDYDDLVPPTLLAKGARLRGIRLRRRRTIATTGLAVALVALVSGGVIAATRPGQSNAELQANPPPSAAATQPMNSITGYVAQWRHGDFDSVRAVMTPTTRAAISADAIRAVFGESGEGRFTGITRAVTVGQTNQGTLTWQHRTAYLTVVNSPAGITGLLFYDKPPSTPITPTALPAAQTRLGTVLTDEVEGRFAAVEAMLSPATAQQLSTGALTDAWKQVTSTFGTVKGFIPGSLSGPEATNGAIIVKGDVLFSGGRLTETLAYDTTGHLIGITFTLPALH